MKNIHPCYNLLSILTGAALGLALVAGPRVASAQCSIRLTWATVTEPGANWLQGIGADVHWNGHPRWDGNFVGGKSYTTNNGVGYYTGLEFQCVELPQRLYTTLGWYLGTWNDNANMFYTSPAPGMQTFTNGSGYIPVPGDLVVWGSMPNQPNGHVAVVNFLDSRYVYLCEENSCSYGTAALTRSGNNGSYFNRTDGFGIGYLSGCVHYPNNPLVTYANAHINPCVARTSDGRLELFAIGQTGYLYHNYQTAPGGAWSGWIALGTSANTWTQNSLPAVGVNADGRLEVFVIGTDGQVNHIWQLAPGSSTSSNWSSFAVLQSSFVSQIAKLAVGKWANGALEVFVGGTDGLLYHSYQSGGAWTSWATIGGGCGPGSDLAVLNEQDGREEVFMVGYSGQLYHSWQTTANSATWTAWNSLGGPLSQTSRIAVGANSDGRLEAFGVGTGGACYNAVENAVNGPTAWSGWTSLGGSSATTAKPVVAADQNGALELFIIGSTGNIYHNYQTGGAWSGWISLGGTFTQDIRPCVGHNQDGRLELFLTGPNTDLLDSSETAPNSVNWSAWTSLGGSWN